MRTHSYKIIWSFYSSKANLYWASTICRASQVALVVKNPPANAGDLRVVGLIPGPGRSPEEGTATRSSILAWGIPWTEEPGGLQSMGSQRGGHDWMHTAQTPLSCTRVPCHPPGAAQGWETQKTMWTHSHSGLASTLMLFCLSRSVSLCSDNFARSLFVTKSKYMH